MSKYLGRAFTILSVLLLFAVISMRFFNIEIVIPRDESLPYYLYISKPLTTVKKGMFASFWHEESKRALGKQIIGLSGDSIHVQNGRFQVNGKDLGEIKKNSKSGRSYLPISSCVIPSGYCFVYGTHDYSFDSRYREMGLVPVDKLRRELWPIF